MTRWQSCSRLRGADYDQRWRALEAAGVDPHGEADFVASFDPGSVLDGGCGTGRVAIELHARGLEVVGVDVDEDMLATARTKAPQISWQLADLAHLALGRSFDVVVLAGNVMIFVESGTEVDVVARCADHLAPDGRLVAGFQLHPGGLDLATYDAAAHDAGLVLEARHATWDEQPWSPGGDYAVSVHRRAL